MLLPGSYGGGFGICWRRGGSWLCHLLLSGFSSWLFSGVVGLNSGHKWRTCCFGGIESSQMAYFVWNQSSYIFVGWRAVSASRAALGIVFNTSDILPIAWFGVFV